MVALIASAMILRWRLAIQHLVQVLCIRSGNFGHFKHESHFKLNINSYKDLCEIILFSKLYLV